MKAADPTIKITAVWMLNGTWNKEVFKEVADVADGVNVHHYAQGANSENDRAFWPSLRSRRAHARRPQAGGRTTA
jgi:hypothetical protein